MATKGNKEIVSLSLDPEVLQLLDNYMKNMELPSRSMALSILIKSAAGKIKMRMKDKEYTLQPLKSDFQ